MIRSEVGVSKNEQRTASNHYCCEDVVRERRVMEKRKEKMDLIACDMLAQESLLGRK